LSSYSLTSSCGPRFPTERHYFSGALIDQVYAIHGIVCCYCRTVPADGLDHIYPWVQGGSNDVGNLIPACTVCNSIAGQRVFRELAQKRMYILARREQLGAERLEQMYRRAALGLRSVGE
jgi:hypothetical protein